MAEPSTADVDVVMDERSSSCSTAASDSDARSEAAHSASSDDEEEEPLPQAAVEQTPVPLALPIQMPRQLATLYERTTALLPFVSPALRDGLALIHRIMSCTLEKAQFCSRTPSPAALGRCTSFSASRRRRSGRAPPMPPAQQQPSTSTWDDTARLHELFAAKGSLRSTLLSAEEFSWSAITRSGPPPHTLGTEAVVEIMATATRRLSSHVVKEASNISCKIPDGVPSLAILPFFRGCRITSSSEPSQRVGCIAVDKTDFAALDLPTKEQVEQIRMEACSRLYQIVLAVSTGDARYSVNLIQLLDVFTKACTLGILREMQQIAYTITAAIYNGYTSGASQELSRETRRTSLALRPFKASAHGWPQARVWSTVHEAQYKLKSAVDYWHKQGWGEEDEGMHDDGEPFCLALIWYGGLQCASGDIEGAKTTGKKAVDLLSAGDVEHANGQMAVCMLMMDKAGKTLETSSVRTAWLIAAPIHQAKNGAPDAAAAALKEAGKLDCLGFAHRPGVLLV
ncbi:hypothetical protein OC842_002372 [Tilletia horrida]|uniref:Uncharacterized protein n=1 Tax=Tilletia horrida TaxID=155126 RepID=A0AAN6JME6_9BASI|nr:hypothetical protein OC842_002372 [Tilletia horrida]